jgi:hypothetical protein
LFALHFLGAHALAFPLHFGLTAPADVGFHFLNSPGHEKLPVFPRNIICPQSCICRRTLVPPGVGPFLPLRSPDDASTDAPAFQQQGVELILRTLREADVPVRIAPMINDTGGVKSLRQDS